MKLITLNIWGGRQGDSLIDFFKKYSDVDVFLLQEVHNNATDETKWVTHVNEHAYSEIAEVLPDHNGYYAPAILEEWGLAAFVKKTISVEEVGDVFVFRSKDSHVGRDGTTLGKNIQYLKIVSEEKNMTIINFHGLWNGKGKTDTEDRMGQSEKIVNFIKNIKDPVVLAGDFNLRPDTQSLKMIVEKLNLKNLIQEYNITSTRTTFYDKAEKFADYILTSQDVAIKDFKVLPDEVSDHSALFLEI